MAKLPDKPVELLTIKDVVKLAQVCEKTVRNEIERRNLACCRIGGAVRIRVDQYNDWIRRGTEEARF